ncbi:hypothetical protein JI435_078480 [Parastagonospora nodorum SN15]|uniref:Uncharacterized protein n=1 Tax=Phaeosphaeria nodorum (strain SN15 / ATCC MYA-4574 / FGSC 10173) TaxID=321614 RepID=A0A7U2EX73_PHANO|nr:hypothetical protein JI435_078480 [Parastagonospora nodorum SN15]
MPYPPKLPKPCKHHVHTSFHPTSQNTSTRTRLIHTQDDTAKPHPHDTQVPSPEQETRSSPRTSFDAFVPTEKLSTWAREDEKVAEQKRTGSLRTRAREKVLGLVGKKRAYGKGGGGG